ncbi:unnamed protein product [Amoebophrya sp. A25]|nr:unnamed protein product [Amoebophrya sp. A25]|eukprot:GSA25T00015512001.1
MASSSSHMTPLGQMDERSVSMNTLDEPVIDTIKRDLNAIGEKLKYVLMPQARVDKGAGLRKWDLWGPLFLCLGLSTILASQAHKDQAGKAFALVFILVWAGSGVVTLNTVLLKGKISFFQSVCVLGYCIFPLVLAAFASALISYKLFKVIFVLVGFIWSTGASVGFMSDTVPEDRKALGVYPVWLFYVAIAWMILLA